MMINGIEYKYITIDRDDDIGSIFIHANEPKEMNNSRSMSDWVSRNKYLEATYMSLSSYLVERGYSSAYDYTKAEEDIILEFVTHIELTHHQYQKINEDSINKLIRILAL